MRKQKFLFFVRYFMLGCCFLKLAVSKNKAKTVIRKDWNFCTTPELRFNIQNPLLNKLSIYS